MKSLFLPCLVSAVIALGCGRNPPPGPPTSPTNDTKMVQATPEQPEVVSEAGNFKIKFPVPPLEKKNTSPEGKPIENYFYETPATALVMGFSYMPLPIAKAELNETVIAGGLQGAAEAYVRSINGKITQKKGIDLGGFQGLEFYATMIAPNGESGDIKGRLYWVDGRLVRVLVVSPKPGWINSKEAN